MSLTKWSKRFSRSNETEERRNDGESIPDYIARVNPRFRMYRHNKLLVETLEACARFEITDLMVWIPPGTGKSETIPRLFGSYQTFMHPTETVGVVSYGAMLAQEMTRDAREYYAEAGGQLDPAQHAKTRWKTPQGGGMWGAGFGGAVRGLRYHAGIVDDPHKGIDDIDSDIKRERLFRWWDTVWMNRAHLYSPHPILRIIVMQRLADNDLCGWLLGRPDADKWTVLALDGIRDTEEPFDIPKGVQVIPDWRGHGESLCPEILTPAKLLEQQADPDSFAAQYQQRPRARSGRIIQPAWFRRIIPAKVPPLLKRAIGVDLAVSTKQSADYTVGLCVGYGVDGNYYLFRPYRDRQESPKNRTEIAALARNMRCGIVAVESVAFQLSFIQELRRMREMAGVAVIEVDADRDKQSRARGWSHLAEQGLMFLVDDGSGWIDKFLDEVRTFPRGRHDDQIDAVGIGLAGIRQMKSGGFAVGGKRENPPATR